MDLATRGAPPPADKRPRPETSFAIDGLAPTRVIGATSEADVAAAIRAANADGEAIVLWGGGTRISIGDPPERYDAALDLRGLVGIVAHEPADLTATVRAGTTVAQLQTELARHGQWWPVEVAHPERATVGGTIASAAGAATRYRYFHVRDWTIGVRAVLGDGTATKAGGRVVKSSTGYDLPRMYSGTFGTLCAITEASLKLTPLPERRLTLRADMPSLAHGFRVGRELVRLRIGVDAIALVAGPVSERLGCRTWAVLFVRLAGSAAAVERLRADLVSRFALEEDESDPWPAIADLPADAQTSIRGTWTSGEPVEVYAVDSVWYPGVEAHHILDAQEPDALRRARAAIENAAGALVIERAPTELRRAVGTWGTARLPVAIARRLRALFDPKGVLAPGRMP